MRWLTYENNMKPKKLWHKYIRSSNLWKIKWKNQNYAQNEGEDTISCGAMHKMTLSTNYVDERRLKSNVVHYDPTNKEVVCDTYEISQPEV